MRLPVSVPYVIMISNSTGSVQNDYQQSDSVRNTLIFLVKDIVRTVFMYVKCGKV